MTSKWQGEDSGGVHVCQDVHSARGCKGNSKGHMLQQPQDVNGEVAWVF